VSILTLPSRPDSLHRDSHDRVKSRADIIHCDRRELSALAITFTTRHTHENKSIRIQPKNVFSGRERRILRISLSFYFLLQFLFLFHIATCNFHVLHSTLIIFCHISVTVILRCSSSSFLWMLLFTCSFSCVSFVCSHLFKYLFVCAPFWCILCTRTWGSEASSMIRRTLCRQPCEAKCLCS
jgi:hypothetical protein